MHPKTPRSADLSERSGNKPSCSSEFVTARENTWQFRQMEIKIFTAKHFTKIALVYTRHFSAEKSCLRAPESTHYPADSYSMLAHSLLRELRDRIFSVQTWGVWAMLFSQSSSPVLSPLFRAQKEPSGDPQTPSKLQSRVRVPPGILTLDSTSEYSLKPWNYRTH